MAHDAERWRKLEVWQLADEFARQVYRATAHFPKAELYGMTAHLRRAALSVPTNIVEGYARRGDRELARFTDTALGSLGETRYLLHFAQTLGYFADADERRLAEHAQHLGQKLWKFYERVRRG